MPEPSSVIEGQDRRIRLLPVCESAEPSRLVQTNRGIEIVDPGSVDHGAYRSGCFHPLHEWFTPSPSGSDDLLGITQGVDLHNTVQIVDAPPEILSLARRLNLERMALSKREYDEGRKQVLPHLISRIEAWLLDEIFDPFELCSAELNVTRPGRTSSTYDPSQERDRGLHIDNWGFPRRCPEERNVSGIRVCVNVGKEARAVVYIPLGLREIADRCRAAAAEPDFLGVALAAQTATPLVELFMRTFPGEAVVKVTLSPGQAYIAPVQYIIHDGYTAGKRHLDLNVQVSSNRFTFLERWTARCLSLADRLTSKTTTARHLSRTPDTLNRASPDSQRFGPLRLLIIQPTPFCNIDCDYCYLPNRGTPRRMDLRTLERVFENVFASDLYEDAFTIVWHAGEPLVMGPAFYNDAIELAKRIGSSSSSVTHSIQTNGILLNEEWCRLIKRESIKIGLSIDGPAFIHDRHRRTRRNGGTHARAMEAVRLLQKHAIRFSVISVITADVLPYPDEYFQFFVESGISDVGFNVEETEGIHKSSSLVGREAAFRSFLQRLYELSKQHPEIRLREFANMGRILLYGQAVFSSQTRPFQQINVDVDGNFSTFSPELLGQDSPGYGNFILGNVHDTSFTEATLSANFRAIYSSIQAGVDRCRRECAYFDACGGGNPSNKYFENGTFDSSETLHCRLTKKVMSDIVLAGLSHAYESESHR